MRVLPRLTLAPGLAWVMALTLAAYLLNRGPYLSWLGPLVTAMLLGVLLRTLLQRKPAGADAGMAFAARTLLRFGIVLLGVRLDARALLALGPWVLLGSLLGVAVAFVGIEWVGRAWRVPREHRRLLAVGTGICGASAIAAALPLVRRDTEHDPLAAPVAIASISLVGTLGVLGFVALDAWTPWASGYLALLAGATLQEVGQAVAAGQAVGGGDAELALLVKLARVMMLAPTLLLLGVWARQAGAVSVGGKRPALLPGFVLGFLLLGLLTSAGVLPDALVAACATAGTLLTASAMAAIGLGVDVRALGRTGLKMLALGLVGFLLLWLSMALWYGWVLRGVMPGA